MLNEGIFYCERCQQRFIVSPDNPDFEHYCSAPGSVINRDDVQNVSTGGWSDYTGSGCSTSRSYYIGMLNKSFGRRAHIQGRAKIPQFTTHGNNAAIFRERQNIQHKDFTEEEYNNIEQ